MYFLKKLVWLYAVHPWLIWREKGWQLNYEVTKDTVMNVGNVSVWQSFPVTIHPEIQTCASGHCQAERGGKEIGSDQSCRFVLCWQQSVRSSGLSQGFAWGEESEAQPGPQKSFRTGDGLMLAPEVLVTHWVWIISSLSSMWDVLGEGFSQPSHPQTSNSLGACSKRGVWVPWAHRAWFYPRGICSRAGSVLGAPYPADNWSCFALWLLVFPPGSSSPAAQGEFLAPRSLLCVWPSLRAAGASSEHSLPHLLSPGWLIQAAPGGRGDVLIDEPETDVPDYCISDKPAPTIIFPSDHWGLKDSDPLADQRLCTLWAEWGFIPRVLHIAIIRI